jgi:GDP-4-dehydro-6-deoxy-D-mannose reductase
MSEKNFEYGGVMVTGAGGFLGGTAMQHLLASGKKVVGTDRNVENELAKKLHLRQLDITYHEETCKFILDLLPETILHFAGIAMLREVASDEEMGKRINVDAVTNLLDAIVNARRSVAGYNPVILVAGTVEQFGDPSTPGEIFTEQSTRNPVNPYGRQKQEMAARFLERCHQENIRGYVVLQGQVSGVSLSGEISQRTGFLIPDLASQVATIEAGGKDRGDLITGVLDNKRPILDVNDAIRAYLELAQKTPAPGEYIVCAEKSVPLTDVLDILIRNSHAQLIHKIDKSRGAGYSDRFYSPKKIMTATGWKPEVDLETTVKRVLEFQRRYWKKQNGQIKNL